LVALDFRQLVTQGHGGIGAEGAEFGGGVGDVAGIGHIRLDVVTSFGAATR
jgi:hypothetical protein